MKYKKSNITVIILDPDQAILQSCKLGGGYMGGGNKCAVREDLGFSWGCPISVRGIREQVNSYPETVSPGS